METIRKKLVVGMSKRTRWLEKLGTVLKELLGVTGLQLNEEETKYFLALPEQFSSLIYARMLRSVVMEFGGTKCVIGFTYYPEEGEQDDLDLSLLGVVDWKVDKLKVGVHVEDAEYAAAVASALAESFSSERLSVEVTDKTDHEEVGDADKDESKPATEGQDGQDSKAESKEEKKPAAEGKAGRDGKADNEEKSKPSTDGEEVQDNGSDREEVK